jgi:hypothetical protein
MRKITRVDERCRNIATFRHVCVQLMETVARWTPTTPEMEAKVMFGRHIWDFAQMADGLGKRTFELRQPEHYTLRPVDAYDTLLKEASQTEATSDRIATLYDGVLPGFIERCRAYVAATDSILDEPSIAIIDRMVREMERQRKEAAELQRELKLGKGRAAAMAAREKSIGSIVVEGVPA